MSKGIVTLDVRDEIRQGREPFTLIMRTVMQLKPKEALRLIAPFEPLPLYGIMANKGFSHTANATVDGDWEVLFERQSGETVSVPVHSPPACDQRRGGTVEVDARGLEPPQPLVKILEAVEQLPPGAKLRARTDRHPVHLIIQLEARGLVGKSEEQADGTFITHIQHG